MKKLYLLIIMLFLSNQIFSQNIGTIAGTGTVVIPSTGDGGLATVAGFGQIYDIALDASHNIYVCDYNNNRLRKINASTGIVNTIVGNGTATSTGDGGLASAATINNPSGVFIDHNENIFIADRYGHRIRKVDAVTGIISTIAGTGVASSTGNGGLATAATINQPFTIFVDKDNNDIYFTEYGGHRVRKINGTTGIISTIAGTGTNTSTGDGGLATAATLSAPIGFSLDASKNIYICEYTGNRVRKINAVSGIISTIVGNGTVSSTGDGGLAASATLNRPTRIHIDVSGNLYICELNGSRVRKVNFSDNIINTIAGTGSTTVSGDGGLATAAGIPNPMGLSIDNEGDIYIPQLIAGSIRKISYPDLNLNQTTDLLVGSSYDFGTINTGNTSPIINFTAQNKGIGDIILMGTTGAYAVLSGPQAAAFSIVQTGLTTPITQGTSKNFTISFSPTVVGVSNAVLTIISNDPNESPYTINLRGTGGILGVNEYQIDKIKLYPNPANDFIQLSGLTETEHYKIYTILGTEVKTGLVSANETINIQSLSKGAYFLKFDNSKVFQFVKE